MSEILKLMVASLEIDTLAAPKVLNGYPVKVAKDHGNGYFTVLVEREGNLDPWVIATWWNDLGSSWSWGHYERTLDEAIETFDNVAERNASRGKA